MRYVIFSDIHANETALRTVLADVVDLRADRLICLGDVLGYGPEPVETLERVYRCVHVCLAGNHDDAVSGRYPVDGFSDEAAASVKRHRAALTEAALDWLRHLPHECRFTSPDGNPVTGAFACVHGDFTDPQQFYYVMEPADATASFAARLEQLLFVGHTHEPGVFVQDETGTIRFQEPEDFTLEEGKRYLVNVGSVGYPRSGVCRSFYCLYDDLTRTVRFRSVPFDVDGFRARMNGAGLEETPWLAARARERRPVSVRRETAFGKAVSGVRHRRRMRVASAGTASGTVPPPVSAVPPPRRNGFVAALVTAAVVLAAAGVWCTRELVTAIPPDTERVAAVRIAKAAVPQVPVQDGEEAARPVPVFADAQPLSAGWSVKVEFPDLQQVRVDSFKATRETVFRMSSRTNGMIRFEKDMALFARPEKVYYTVRMVSPVRVGGRVRFRFLSRVLFYDARGRYLSEDVHAGRRSVSNKAVRVPEGAETARLQVDCTAFGNYDLVVPPFKCEPLETKKKEKRGRR